MRNETVIDVESHVVTDDANVSGSTVIDIPPKPRQRYPNEVDGKFFTGQVMVCGRCRHGLVMRMAESMFPKLYIVDYKCPRCEPLPPPKQIKNC